MIEQKIEILVKLDKGETTLSLACDYKQQFWILKKPIMQSLILC